MTRPGGLLGAVAVWAAPGRAFALPSAPPDQVRRTVGEVFERPEFRDAESGGTTWLARPVLEFLAWLAGLHQAAPVLFWLLLLGCLAVLVALVLAAVLQIRKLFAADTRSGARQAAQAQRARLSLAHREEADRRAAAGDYTEAIRFLFLSLVYRFDEGGRVGLHKDYTNREYLELAGENGRVQDSLRVLVDILDDHWYGQRPCRQPQYESCLAVYHRLSGA